MNKYVIPAVIALILILAVLWAVGKRSVPDLGTLVAYHYSNTGAMGGNDYTADIRRDEDGTVRLIETIRPGHPRALPIVYRRRLEPDTLTRIENYLKEHALWVRKPFRSSKEIVLDGASSRWSFTTDRGFYTIYSGMMLTPKVRARIQDLNEFIGSLIEDSEREKLPDPPLTPEDVAGISLRYGGESFWINLLEEKNGIWRNLAAETVGCTPEELLAGLLERYGELSADFGAAIWDRYPLPDAAHAPDSSRLSCELWLVIPDPEYGAPHYALVPKFQGRASEQFAEHIRSMLDYALERTKPAGE